MAVDVLVSLTSEDDWSGFECRYNSSDYRVGAKVSWQINRVKIPREHEVNDH